MADGNAPRRREPRAYERLLGRVHIPIQPPHLEISRQIVLSTGATGRADRPRSLRHSGQTTTGCTRWRQVNIPIMEKTKIWVVSELYSPEFTSTGYFLTGIAEGLAAAYDVSVLCGQPSYWARGVRAPAHEILHGADVHRCWATTFDKNKILSKIINQITISASMFWAALFRLRRRDIVIAVTNPPLLPYLMALACWVRGARYILLIHDVYPEIFTRIGILKPQSISVRLMDLASRWLYNSADRIIVLGRDMRDLVIGEAQGASEPSSHRHKLGRYGGGFSTAALRKHAAQQAESEGNVLSSSTAGISGAHMALKI